MSEKKRHRVFFDKIEKFFDWVTDIYARITDYHNLAGKHKKGLDRIKGLYLQNQRLKTQTNLQEEVIIQKNGLIDHLKNDKKGLVSLLEQMRDKTPETLIEFLEKDVHYKQPYMFVNSKGVVLGCTERFKKILGLSNGLIGKNYLEVLGEGYADINDLRRIKKVFNTYKEREFDIIIEKEKEKTRFHVIKEPPILFRDLNVRRIGKKKTISPIAFIPVYVRPVGMVGKLKRRIYESSTLKDLVQKELEDEAKQNSARIHAQLIKYKNYGWRDADKIMEIVEGMGIVDSYLYLKNELLKIVEQEEEKKGVIGSLVNGVLDYKKAKSI